MTPELQRYYEDRLAMTGSQAWKDLMDDVKEMLAATNTLDSTDTLEKLHFKKGEVSMMRWMLSIAEISEATYIRLQEDDDAEATS